MVRVGDDAAPRRPRRNIAQKAAHALASMTSAPTVTHSFNELHDLRQTVSNPGLTPMERPEEIEAFGRQQRAGSGDDRRVRLLNALMPLAGEAEESCSRAACDDNTCQKMVNTRGVLYARAEEAMRHAEEDLINELRQRRNHRYARACGDSALLRMLHIPMGRSGDGGVEEAEDTPDEDEDVEAAASARDAEESETKALVLKLAPRITSRPSFRQAVSRMRQGRCCAHRYLGLRTAAGHCACHARLPRRRSDAPPVCGRRDADRRAQNLPVRDGKAARTADHARG
jgi:hypothetical protein